jgi:hypothetical protein
MDSRTEFQVRPGMTARRVNLQGNPGCVQSIWENKKRKEEQTWERIG